MYPSSTEQAAHLPDILGGVPAIKIEQKLCCIDQNSQRGANAFLAAGKGFEALMEGICVIW